MALAGCPENNTGMAIFMILGFHTLPALNPFLFAIFLTVYLLTVAANSLILITVVSDVRLHSPMYFFLGSLSMLEIWYTTSIFPTLFGSQLGKGISISYPVCIIQFSLFCWLTATECFLLTVMAYDRYLAICQPLHYSTVMDLQLCIYLAASAWVIAFLIAMTNTLFLCMLQFPNRILVDHFFCDLAPILKGACSDTSQVEMEVFLFSFVVISFPFLFVIVSYVFIISAILKIPSTTGKSKAFSTCSSHLIIVIAYFGILILVYAVPSKNKSQTTNQAFSLLYTVVTPLFNPVVYSLRNKEMKGALKKHFNQNVI